MRTYEKNLSTGVTREYAYLNNQIIGWKETDNTGNSVKRYAATDLLGSVTTVTDESGTVLWSGEYTAFGNVAYGSGDVLYDGMYTGKDIDSETGLTYHWNRWRSEDGSSFISEDPARDGSNWYGYCGNNPINSTDPTGLYVDYSQGGRKEVDDTTGKVVSDISNNGTDNLAGGPEQGPAEPKNPEEPDVKVPYSWDQFVSEIEAGFKATFNLDFGFDYTQYAAQAWNNGNYGMFVMHEIAATCEMAFDLGVAYLGAQALGAFVSAPSKLMNSESWLKSDGSPNYPKNQGAVPGTEKVTTISANTTLGRYGVINSNSNFVTQTGVSATELSLPPWTNPNVYTELKVLKDIPGVTESIVAPWAGSTGGALQYQLPKTINQLIYEGYISY